MSIENIKISKNFKEKTTKSIWSIIFFILIYFILALGGLALTILTTYLGVQIITIKFNWFILLVSVGVISIGFLVLFFLIKFIFKKHLADYSNMTEIKRENEPKLFSFLDEIVLNVGTNSPKRVYLTPDVNASVFYDSNFWSMFLPIKKNLQIGLGLVNSVSENEFKAILAHEFGHFSQRTMKVGSYVYNVNQIIYNLLYDNDTYGKVVEYWANLHSILGFFAGLAVKIVEGIQWVLRKVYEYVNLNYLSLSREMEFHADEVAANDAGSNHLINSLLRLDLAESSYNSVLDFYSKKISESIKTSNIFPQQFKLMNFLASENEIPIHNNFPHVSIENINRFNKSKLVFENQWSSHPSTEDRISKLKSLNLELNETSSNPASNLFSDFNKTEIKITSDIFSNISYTEDPKLFESDEFLNQFKKEYEDSKFNKIFNHYFDNKNIAEVKSEEILMSTNAVFEDFFNQEMIELIYTNFALEQDILTIENLNEANVNIKSFDYGGIKYTKEDASNLLEKLKIELEISRQKIKQNDINVFCYFINLSKKLKKHQQFEKEYFQFIDFDKEYDLNYKLFNQFTASISFIFETTPLDKIKLNIESMKPIEKEVKDKLQSIINSDINKKYFDNEKLDLANNYINNKEEYFQNNEYNQNSINLLNDAINLFQEILNKTYFNLKKQLLETMAQIHLTKIQ